MQQVENRSLLYFGANGVSDSVLGSIRSAGWDVAVASAPEQACRMINEQHIHVGLAQVDTTDAELLLPIEELMHRSGRIEWIGLFEPSALQKSSIKKMIGESFYDFHTLPPDPPRLLTALGHAYGMAHMKWEEGDVLDRSQSEEEEMVGTSPLLQNLFQGIRKVAGVAAPLLITGESGTGKELAAKAVHERSMFRNGPFVAVNCGAMPGSLVQSELFGYEKGAFTGAQQRKIGHIESANGGTIFLDEIGDLPLEQQINLLRFLQEKTIQRVGGTEQIHVDARVIAATHVNLERAVAEGRFREDLYYRLNVLQLKTPALKEREGDVELLAKYFFEKFVHEKRHNVKGFSQSCINAMNQYAWPGNVRELINRVRRAMVMCENKLISAEDLGIGGTTAKLQWVTLKEAKERAEREIVRDVVDRTRDNLTLAARHLGVSRVTLYRLLEKYEIRP